MGYTKDKTGERYGHWIVKQYDELKSKESNKNYWICECDCGCGTTKSIRGDSLYSITIGGCYNMASSIAKKCLKC